MFGIIEAQRTMGSEHTELGEVMGSELVVVGIRTVRVGGQTAKTSWAL